MELTKEEQSALNGEKGEALQTAYRILVATGEATNAEKLVPVNWAHLSGVNYNKALDNTRALLFPLYVTAFCLCDYLQEKSYFHSSQILMLSGFL